jgi:hypothetical protein
VSICCLKIKFCFRRRHSAAGIGSTPKPFESSDGRLATAMGGAAGKHEGERAVWPPGWCVPLALRRASAPHATLLPPASATPWPCAWGWPHEPAGGTFLRESSWLSLAPLTPPAQQICARLEIPENPRRIARNAILDISALPPSQFVLIAAEPYCISADVWNFSEYHAAAAAAVQEDSRLNKLTYACVPRRLSESDFWRLVRASYRRFPLLAPGMRGTVATGAAALHSPTLPVPIWARPPES